MTIRNNKGDNIVNKKEYNSVVINSAVVLVVAVLAVSGLTAAWMVWQVFKFLFWI